MKLRFSREAEDDYDYWHENDIETWKKVKALIKRIQRDPRDQWGKPKKLQREYKGWSSRRITLRHRLVYRIVHESRVTFLDILQCRGHYADDDGKVRKMPTKGTKRARNRTK